MEKIIIEVGSTNTKIDKFNGKEIERLESITIEFKRNYKIQNILDENDVNILINKVNELKKDYVSIYICGTSIFRTLPEEQKQCFLNKFKEKTGIEFDIISIEKENELTVKGATKKVNSKVGVFVGGGGSTEIAIYDNGIKEMVNTPIGVMDVLSKFSDLSGDIAKSNLEDVKNYIKENLNIPKEKVDILILAGGGHKNFALNSGINYEKNTVFEDELQPIMMTIESRTKDTYRYYKEISLDEIRSRVSDPKWWDATRAMSAFVLVVAQELGVKYIIPTDISMVYGIF